MRVLMLGDSVAERASKHDTDRRTLDAMLADLLPADSQLDAVTGSGSHIGVFRQTVLKLLAERPGYYSVIVLPINMRSFSPQWWHNPKWQYDGEQHSWETYFAITDRPPLSSLSTLGEFVALTVTRSTTPAAVTNRLREIFLWHYTHPLTRDHPRLAQLVDLIRLAGEARVPIVAYTTPLNYHAGQEYAGPPFMDAATDNVALVVEVLAPYTADRNVLLLNLWNRMPRDDFIRPDEATEHLNQDGRRLLAIALSEGIREATGVRG